ncbi:unnamed protein product [Adineta steineri]|uniref:Uncharacterized protein n=1 Tax=Adineta steineri TaxID=433720 RepID=A0A815DZF0_9BILA|nr:unnamed protein product [Adineta steineri]CAF3518549.1 unnamed protein product [Adineta steineri]
MTVWFSLALLVICSLSNGQQTCDPRTFSPDDYPGRLTKFDVVGTNPLKLRAHISLINSTNQITFEGMVMAYSTCTVYFPKSTQMKEKEVLTACRSLGCSESPGTYYTSWNQTETCEYKCPDGRKANRKCSYMVDSLACKDDSMNLVECMTTTLFRFASSPPSNPSSSKCGSQGVSIVCRECGDE